MDVSLVNDLPAGSAKVTLSTPASLVFEPYYRPQVWGGRRLQELLSKPLPADSGPIGESWELSGFPREVSRVADGPWKGRSLNQLWQQYRHEWGCSDFSTDPERFPILVKLLDCQRALSVQVHPNCEQARQLGVDTTGKSEAWVVLGTEPGSQLYVGWKPGVTEADVQQHLAAGTLVELLHTIEPQVGDCFDIPAGTVHALGAGLVLLEVQQTSDATFRLFDWNRPGSDGLPRPLQIEQSLACLNWGQSAVEPQVPEPLTDLPAGVTGEQLVSNPYFRIDRYHSRARQLTIPSIELTVWVILRGHGTLYHGDETPRQLVPGQTIVTLPHAEPFLWERTSSEPLTVIQVRLPHQD